MTTAVVSDSAPPLPLLSIIPKGDQLDVERLNKAQSMIEKLVHTNCGICMDWLIQPVFLPCGHFFCHECLANQINNLPDSSSGKCAVCRYRFGILESYGSEGKKKLLENIRPQPELGLLIEFLAGPEYKERINQKARKKMREKIVEEYCCSPRAEQIQDAIEQNFRDNESLNIQTLSEMINCPIEEIYYHLLIYCNSGASVNGVNEKGWMESNQPGFTIWNQRYLFFKNYVIDTSSLGEMTPLLLIDTQIMGLSITDKYYLSLLAAGKSHWKYHCKQPNCEGVRMVLTHLENLDKQQKNDPTSNSFLPSWLAEYRQNPAPAWLETFYQLIEKLHQEDLLMQEGKAKETEFLKAEKNRKKEKKELKNTLKKTKSKLGAVLSHDQVKNVADAIASSVESRDQPQKPDDSWKQLSGFNEIANFFKNSVAVKSELSDQAKQGLACQHCSEYPCGCSRCDDCGFRILECRCDSNQRAGIVRTLSQDRVVIHRSQNEMRRYRAVPDDRTDLDDDEYLPDEADYSE